MSLNNSEPPPRPPPMGGRPIWDLIIEDVVSRHPASEVLDRFVAMARERDAKGRAHYGMPLRARNGRNPLRDAIQESADKAAYLMQAVEEGDPVESHYRREVESCMSLIAILARKAGKRHEP